MSELDRFTSDKNENQKIPDTLPMLPVRDIILYPAMVLPLAVGREKLPGRLGFRERAR